MTRRLIACRYCMIRAINAAVEVIGDRWSLLVLRDVMFGNRRHFRVLEDSSEEGIASNILADRLRRLVSAGLLMRADAGCGRRATYSLTEAAIEVSRCWPCSASGACATARRPRCSACESNYWSTAAPLCGRTSWPSCAASTWGRRAAVRRPDRERALGRRLRRGPRCRDRLRRCPGQRVVAERCGRRCPSCLTASRPQFRPLGGGARRRPEAASATLACGPSWRSEHRIRGARGRSGPGRSRPHRPFPYHRGIASGTAAGAR
jgi:DNA-binding HxlR family transcriptional regulator